MKTRDYWRKLARKTNHPLAWAGYKNFNREVRRELRFAEQEYAETQIRNNSNNMGCIWKTIRSFIPKKSVNRKSYSKQDKLVANKFNEYFTSIGQNTIKSSHLLTNATTILRNRLLSQSAIHYHNSLHLGLWNAAKLNKLLIQWQQGKLLGTTKSH